MRATARNKTIAALMMLLVLALPVAARAQDAGAPAASPNVQVPQPSGGGVNWPGAGYGAGALFGNVLYIPGKLVYALLGGLVGGGAWLLTGGNTQTANTIWRSSLGGDYVLTPDMVAGNQPIHFSGPTDTAPPEAQSVAPVNAPAPAAAITPAPSAPASASNGGGPIDRGAGPVRSGPALPETRIE
ncbi:MAG TPA: hypothetical protein VIX12_10350 [Candidatus Binataceae bacterium]